MYLTKSEQAIAEKLPSGGFTLDEIAAVTRIPRRYLIELLRRLVHKKKLARVGRGAYFFGAAAPERMALSLEPTGYVGLFSALKIFGLVDEELSRVFIATKNKRGRKTVGAFDVEFIPLNNDFYGVVEVDGLRVSTRAKTFFDCIKKISLTPGRYTVVQTLKRASLTTQEWRELLYYLENTESKSLKQRAGFLLEEAAPEWFLKKLEKLIGEKAVVKTDFNLKGFNKQWGIYNGSRS